LGAAGEIFDAKSRVWGQFGPENKLIEGQPNEQDVICQKASVLAFHLWPTIFAGASFWLQDICRNGVTPRSRTTTPLHSAIQPLILKALKASQMSSLREAYILSYHQTVMYIHSETERQRADSNCPCNRRSWCGTTHRSHHTEPATHSTLQISTTVVRLPSVL